MNDKRCPICDLLVDEGAARCSCDFVFWDDTPRQKITSKRLLVTSTLLFLSGSLGVWFSYSALSGHANFALGILSSVIIVLGLLPNLQKQGSLALSSAMIALLWASYFSGREWRAMNPVKDTAFVAQAAYKPGIEPTMGGLKLGDAVPKTLPAELKIGVSSKGQEIVYIAGGSLFQGDDELLRPGDSLERIKTKFPVARLEDSVLMLGGQKSLALELEGNLIKNFALVNGSELGKGSSIDGVRIGMNSSLAQSRIRNLQNPPLVFSGATVVAVRGHNLMTPEGIEIRRGQSIEELPTLRKGRKEKPFSIRYDENGKVDDISLGSFTDRSLAPTIIPEKLAMELEAEYVFQSCLETDEKYRVVGVEETWGLPERVVTVRRRSHTGNSYLKNESLPHNTWTEELRASEWSVGERSHWSHQDQFHWMNCEFLHRGQYFTIEAKTNFRGNRFPPDKTKPLEPDFVEKIGRAIVAAREGKSFDRITKP